MTDVPTWGGGNLADIVAIYGRGRKLFRPPTYDKNSIRSLHKILLPLHRNLPTHHNFSTALRVLPSMLNFKQMSLNTLNADIKSLQKYYSHSCDFHYTRMLAKYS